ncbi:uncharacterized protein LOC128245376 isoform X1 [Mya arenaria]|uniref:uncharacterized protein LOC128245376 isoform X1 n=1 Tax=Mya arenaria TaxID=6604 RepID=UPI0022E520CE|nr:uncharacterized protein LOC128245376 isoform X1 [Mya arenaria]
MYKNKASSYFYIWFETEAWRREWIDDVFSQHNNYLLPNERFKFKDKALSLQCLMIDAYREAQAKKHIGIKVTISNFIILDDEQNKDDLVDLIRMNKTRVKSIFINKSNAIFNYTDLQGIFNDSSQTLMAVELDERDGCFDLTKCNNIRYMWLQGTDCTSVLLDPTHIVALELRNTSHAIEQQILDGISTNSPNLLHLSLSKMKEAQLLHQTIPELTCLQTVYIGDTDFGERCIYFPPSVKGVTLCNVTMSANSMIGMLKKIGTSNMSAHIFLHNCIVTDKSRLQNIRASLETSEGLSVKSFQEKVNHLYAHITTLHVQSVDEEPETSIIPDRAKLNVICAEKGRRSDEVLAFTDTICDTIREKLDSHFTARNLKTKVVDIYASYPKEDEISIIFVITNTHKVQDEVVMQVVDYGFVLKSLDSATTESKLNEAEFEDFLPQADICKLNQYISINSKQLFQCHSNLRIVTGSRVDVSRFSERKRVCIQLFVHAKGFIPLREEPFPKQYEGFTVIVSEGICVLYTNLAATERHDELKIGCQIMRAELFDANHLPLNGTLGGFFEHPEYGLCGMSCAHVLLSKTELTRCKENNGKVHYPDVNASVYQPSYAESNKIGHLVQAIYDEGNEQEAGVELAVFNISDREPLSGAFPAIKLDDHAVSHFKSYNSGTTLGKALLTGKQVWKFGMATQLTDGYVGTIVCSIKVPPLKYDLLGHSLELYNQLQVYSRNKSETFADKGDSGALVFYDRPNGESVCVGMVVGGWIGEENVAAVMPIDTIIRQLGVQQLKPFFKSIVSEDIVNLRSELNKTNENVERLRGETRQSVDQINSKLDELLRIIPSNQ